MGISIFSPHSRIQRMCQFNLKGPTLKVLNSDMLDTFQTSTVPGSDCAKEKSRVSEFECTSHSKQRPRRLLLVFRVCHLKVESSLKFCESTLFEFIFAVKFSHALSVFFQTKPIRNNTTKRLYKNTRVPSISLIKRCIESLMEKQYLQRMEETKDTYQYVAQPTCHAHN